MTHELACALQQARRIRQRCAVKKTHVDVRGEYIDIAEGRISQTGDRTAVMPKLPDFVSALSHHLKPLMRDGSQFTGMLVHPRIDSGITLDSAVESQQQFPRLHGLQFIIVSCRTFSAREKKRAGRHWPARCEQGVGTGRNSVLVPSCFQNLLRPSSLMAAQRANPKEPRSQEKQRGRLRNRSGESRRDIAGRRHVFQIVGIGKIQIRVRVVLSKR